MRSLRRFPIARKVAQHQLLQKMARQYDRRLGELVDEPASHWTVSDPFGEVPNAMEDESVEEYDLPYRVIQPLSCLTLTGRTDQTNSKLWNSLRAEFSGLKHFSPLFSLTSNSILSPPFLLSLPPPPSLPLPPSPLPPSPSLPPPPSPSPSLPLPPPPSPLLFFFFSSSFLVTQKK